jgi:hypothetical protein
MNGNGFYLGTRQPGCLAWHAQVLADLDGPRQRAQKESDP